ncbi:PH domain-containing protein [Corynebacterium sp. 32222D000AT]|uniref:PH domain-containing protein n=1 Tax=unclassified Corynebacterium TaxID=2624378 RepID=UPI002A97CAAA|nr:PH domain-containing protein [Mycobacteriaceae bacterium]MDY5828322.1 PH domain-containing protein [Corynebacterium sp.]
MNAVASPELNPVSQALVKARYINAAIWLIALALGVGALGFFWASWWYWGLIVIAAFGAWLAWLIPAQVRNLGWLETDDELLITRGKLWHTFTVVPYGRIQFVDATAGPIQRWLGIKKLQLHTASATTDATVKGLPAQTADQLRERLAVKARERMSGL